MDDGRVKIIAEGDDKLKWFEEAIDVKNTLIKVSSIERSIPHQEAISASSTSLWKRVRPILGWILLLLI